MNYLDLFGPFMVDWLVGVWLNYFIIHGAITEYFWLNFWCNYWILDFFSCISVWYFEFAVWIHQWQPLSKFTFLGSLALLIGFLFVSLKVTRYSSVNSSWFTRQYLKGTSLFILLCYVVAFVFRNRITNFYVSISASDNMHRYYASLRYSKPQNCLLPRPTTAKLIMDWTCNFLRLQLASNTLYNEFVNVSEGKLDILIPCLLTCTYQDFAFL